MIRAKFSCHFVEKHNGQDGVQYAETVHLGAVTDDSPENKEWSKATPGGNLGMHISNPGAFGKFEQGKAYFIDFTPAE